MNQSNSSTIYSGALENPRVLKLMPKRHRLIDVLRLAEKPLDSKLVVIPDQCLVPALKEAIRICELTEFVDLCDVLRSCIFGYWSERDDCDDYEVVVHEYLDQWMSNWNEVQPSIYIESDLEHKTISFLEHLLDLKPYVVNAMAPIAHELGKENISYMGVERVIGTQIVLLFEYDN